MGEEGSEGWDPVEHFALVCWCHLRVHEALVFLETSPGPGCLGSRVYAHEKTSGSKNGSFCSEFHMVRRQVETDQGGVGVGGAGSEVNIPEPTFLS